MSGGLVSESEPFLDTFHKAQESPFLTYHLRFLIPSTKPVVRNRGTVDRILKERKSLEEYLVCCFLSLLEADAFGHTMKAYL